MWRRVLRPWNAAALPEIMAGALQESKLDVPVPFHEGQAAGQKPGSAAGARGGGMAEARARPNVEVNRRAATLVRVEPPVRRQRARLRRIFGCEAATLSRVLAAPVGSRRPCSQSWSVRADIPKRFAKSCCDSPVLARASTAAGNLTVVTRAACPSLICFTD